MVAERKPRRPVDERDQLDFSRIKRDVRPAWESAWILLGQPVPLAILLGAGSIIIMVLPVLLPLFLLFSPILMARYRTARREHLNMRLPKIIGNVTDYGQRLPSGKKQRWSKADGTFLFGNAALANDVTELYYATGDILTHMLVLGTTGAGKTESMLSLAINALAQASSFSYTDPKGSVKLYAQASTAARLFGRDDDLLLQSFITPERQLSSDDYLRVSNTTNPLSRGTSDSCLQIMASLIKVGDGDNAIFGQNAQTLMSGLLDALVSKRNNSNFVLSFRSLGHYLQAQNAVTLLEDEAVDERAKDELLRSLSNLGYQPGKKFEQQGDAFYDQYQYASAYFALGVKIMGSVHNNVFGVEIGDIDPVDVIRQRRIQVTILPAMQKAPAQLAELGKVILTAQRTAVSIGLGVWIEGHRTDTLESIPTLGRSPFLNMVDEFAAIPIEGFEILLTQGRSLGIATIIGNQDAAGIMEVSKKMWHQIVSNTKIKAILAQEDPQVTFDLVKALTGSAFVSQSSGFDGASTMFSYRDQLQANVQQVEIADFRDLQELVEGECFLSFRGKWIPAKTFYANPDPQPGQHDIIHRFVPLYPPTRAEVEINLGRAEELARVIGRWVAESGEQDAAEEGGVPGPVEAVLSVPLRRKVQGQNWAAAAMAAMMHEEAGRKAKNVRKFLEAKRNQLPPASEEKERQAPEADAESSRLADPFADPASEVKQKEEVRVEPPKEEEAVDEQSQAPDGVEKDGQLKKASRSWADYMMEMDADQAALKEDLEDIEEELGGGGGGRAEGPITEQEIRETQTSLLPPKKETTREHIAKKVDKALENAYPVTPEPEEKTTDEIQDLVESVLKGAAGWQVK